MLPQFTSTQLHSSSDLLTRERGVLCSRRDQDVVFDLGCSKILFHQTSTGYYPWPSTDTTTANEAYIDTGMPRRIFWIETDDLLHFITAVAAYTSTKRPLLLTHHVDVIAWGQHSQRHPSILSLPISHHPDTTSIKTTDENRILVSVQNSAPTQTDMIGQAQYPLTQNRSRCVKPARLFIRPKLSFLGMYYRPFVSSASNSIISLVHIARSLLRDTIHALLTV